MQWIPQLQPNSNARCSVHCAALSDFTCIGHSFQFPEINYLSFSTKTLLGSILSNSNDNVDISTSFLKSRALHLMLTCGCNSHALGREKSWDSTNGTHIRDSLKSSYNKPYPFSRFSYLRNATFNHLSRHFDYPLPSPLSCNAGVSQAYVIIHNNIESKHNNKLTKYCSHNLDHNSISITITKHSKHNYPIIVSITTKSL
jgi:hypothetical protein